MVAKMQNPKERIHRAMMTNTSTLVKNVKVKLKRIWHDADGVKASFLVIHAAHLDDARRFRDPAPKLLSRIRGKKFPPTWGANGENLIMLRFVWIMRKLFFMAKTILNRFRSCMKISQIHFFLCGLSGRKPTLSRNRPGHRYAS